MAQSLSNGNEVLFVGTDTAWDYKPFFWNPSKQCPYFTLDNNSNYNPDIVADIQKCPEVPDDKFSLILLIGVYEFLDHKAEAFAEIKRILCKDGFLLVALPGKGYYNDNRGVARSETLEVLKDFRVLETYFIYEGNEEPNSIICICQKL
jgi:SAM-dependent methyltransferase